MAGRDKTSSDRRSSLREWLRSGRAPLIGLGLVLLFLAVTYAVVLSALRPVTPGRQLTLDGLGREITDGRITGATFLQEDLRFTGTDDKGRWWFATGANDILNTSLLQTLAAKNVPTRIDAQSSKNLLKLSTSILLPAATLIAGFAFLYSVLQRPGGGELGLLRKSRGRRFEAKAATDVTFAEVAGLPEAIEELREVKAFLASPESFSALGAKPPRGILLSGPPGCGKTLLARALAGEAGVPFYSISASEFVEVLVGVGAARVRGLFEKAQATAPSIIFVDELDAIGRARASGDTLNAEGESTLNELLVQLDGFDTSASRVVLMAATNRPDILDMALLRKGRFDRQIVIDAPDLAGRIAIAKVHAKGKPLGPDVDLESFARRTVGLTGADIAAALNEAATLAARRNLSKISQREIGDAVERIQAGPERKSRVLSAIDKNHVAFHEAGHTLVGWVLDTASTVEKVSIVSRGHSLGSTWRIPIDDRRVRSRSRIEDDLAVALAGRAAESIVFDDPADGSHADLAWASQTARFMVFELGMSDVIGPFSLGADDGAYSRQHSSELLAEAETEVRRLLDAADQRARAVINTHRPKLDELASLLVAHETLERSDLEAVLGKLAKGGPRVRKAAARSRSATARP